MRARILAGLAAAALCAGCGADGESLDSAIPTVAMQNEGNCGVAAEWRQRGAEARSDALATSSDQARVVSTSRANYFASMAVAAELHCSIDGEEPARHLEAALAAARTAEGATGFYEQAIRWGDAQHAATEAIDLLAQRLTHR